MQMRREMRQYMYMSRRSVKMLQRRRVVTGKALPVHVQEGHHKIAEVEGGEEVPLHVQEGYHKVAEE